MTSCVVFWSFQIFHSALMGKIKWNLADKDDVLEPHVEEENKNQAHYLGSSRTRKLCEVLFTSLMLNEFLKLFEKAFVNEQHSALLYQSMLLLDWK